MIRPRYTEALLAADLAAGSQSLDVLVSPHALIAFATMWLRAALHRHLDTLGAAEILRLSARLRVADDVAPIIR